MNTAKYHWVLQQTVEWPWVFGKLNETDELFVDNCEKDWYVTALLVKMKYSLYSLTNTVIQKSRRELHIYGNW